MALYPTIVLVALLVAGAVWVRYLLRKGKPASFSTEIRKISLDEIWQTWIDARNPGVCESEPRDALLDRIDESDLAAVHADLVTMDRENFSGDYPLTRIRLEIMASVDRQTLNEELLNLPDAVLRQVRQANPDILQDNDQARRYLVANELRLLVLREYAGQRFGDYALPDWLDVYLRAARIKQKTLQSMIENSMQEEITETTVRLQAIQLVDEKLREQLLRVPPGTVFDALEQGS